MKTLGQMVDEATKAHEARYPGSTVYAAEVARSVEGRTTRVELQADHFSVTIVYHVTEDSCTEVR